MSFNRQLAGHQPVPEFNQFLFANPQLKLLPGYGWNDGGCMTLALALSFWAGERITLVGLFTLAPHRLQHAVVRLKNTSLYLDADGLFLREALEAKMTEWENCTSTRVEPLHVGHLESELTIEVLPEVAVILARRLERRFGSFDEFFTPSAPLGQ